MTARLLILVAIVVIAASALACSNADASVTSRFNNRLAVDESTKSSQIDVRSANRVVTLAGSVDSATAKSKAVELARATDGVRGVVDKLVVITTPAAGVSSGPAQPQAPPTAAMSNLGPGMMGMHRGEMGMPPEGMMREMRGGSQLDAAAAQPPAMRPLSALPGMPGVSHVYHIGSTGFFLDQPQLQLTADQQSRLRQIMERALLERTNGDRAIQQAEQEIWTLTGDGADAARIEAKIAETERARTNQRIEFIRAVGEAIGALTPEQRNTLVGAPAAKD